MSPTQPKIARWALAAVLTVGLLFALLVIRGEWITARYEAWADRAAGGAPPPPWTPAPSANLCAEDCPPRALAASGVQTAVLAAQTHDPNLRARLLGEAEDRLSRALRVEPVNGEWWAWRSYVRWLRGGDPAGLMGDLARSYQTAPYLLHEGPWRARLAALHWARLDPPTRTLVINEVVWMRDVDSDGFASVLPAFFDPAATRALAQRLSKSGPGSVPHRRGGVPNDVGAAND